MANGNLGRNFYPKLVQISSELGMKPEDLLAVMVSESGINPSAKEQKYNGGGLMGFMPQTLKNLKFQGTPEDFRKLSGEQQLDWVKKLVQGNMSFNGGKPFKSATQYYMANFVPVALGLPGIKAEDPKCAFLEKYPAAVKDPKSGELLSKKYYDIGVKLSPKKERLFYEANPLFHGSTANAITYGDMLNQVNKNKSSAAYNQALAAMKAQTGYTAEPNSSYVATHNIKRNDTSNHGSLGFIDGFTNLLKQFVFASNKNNYLISLAGRDYSSSLEYANILSTAINEYLNIKTSINSNDNKIVISFTSNDKSSKILPAVQQLANSISEVFHEITSFHIEASTISANEISLTNPIHPKLADLHHNKFLNKLKVSDE